MTRDEILSMEPGRELDVLVMRIVFKVEKKDIGNECYWVSEVNGEEVRWPRWLFSPSTDIAAAWEVEKRALEINGLLYVAALMQVIYGDIDKVDYIENIDPDNAIKWCALPALFKATPEQRCKAALLAVMEGEKDDRTSNV